MAGSGFYIVSVRGIVQRASASPGELLVQKSKEQDGDQTCWKGTGFVPSYPTALLNWDWRSNVRSPGSQPRDPSRLMLILNFPSLLASWPWIVVDFSAEHWWFEFYKLPRQRSLPRQTQWACCLLGSYICSSFPCCFPLPKIRRPRL